MTWPFENDTSAIVKKLAGRSMQADKRNKAFLLLTIKAMHLPAELCKMQRKKRETDGFSKSTWMTPPGSHPTSGFGARHGPPKFFRHKKRRIVQNDAADWWT